METDPLSDKERYTQLVSVVRRVESIVKPTRDLDEVERLECIAWGWECFTSAINDCFHDQSNRIAPPQWGVTLYDVRIALRASVWAGYTFDIRHWRQDATNQAAERLETECARGENVDEETASVLATRPNEPRCDKPTRKAIESADMVDFRWPTHLDWEEALQTFLQARRERNGNAE